MILKSGAELTDIRPNRTATVLRLLWADKFATAAAIFILLVVLCAIFGPALFEKPASAMNLRGRNLALALGLVAWVVLIFVITIVKMKGG